MNVIAAICILGLLACLWMLRYYCNKLDAENQKLKQLIEELKKA